ncbi:MAG: hypothetical protein AAF745_18205, partial [Planctomycetota bacterium]
MSNSDSSTNHSNAVANAVVVAGLMFSAAFVSWQLSRTTPNSETVSAVVATEVSNASDTNSAADLNNLNTTASTTGSDSDSVALVSKPSRQTPMQRTRLSKATLRLQQRAIEAKKAAEAKAQSKTQSIAASSTPSTATEPTDADEDDHSDTQSRTDQSASEDV